MCQGYILHTEMRGGKTEEEKSPAENNPKKSLTFKSLLRVGEQLP